VLFLSILVSVSILLRPCLEGRAFAADTKTQGELETTEQALVNLDYDTANKGAERVLKHRGLTHEQLVRAYRVLALTHAVLDHEAAARDAFQFLLVIDPEYQGDPNLGPKVQAPFMEARGFLRAQAIKPGVETSVSVRAGEGGTLRVTTRDPTHIVKKVGVGWRWGGEGTFTTSIVAAGDGQLVQVSAPPPGASRLDYYAQALDDRDAVLFEAGNANVPKNATIEAPAVGAGGGFGGGGERPAESSSVFASPVFWIVAGVLVAGGVTTVVLVTSKEKTQDQVVTQPATFLTPGLQCGLVKCN
jgi:hypothetical protein